MEILQDVELSPSEARVVARLMLAVARADGSVDERERALIEEIAHVDPNEADPTPAEAAAELPLARQKELAVTAALLVAFVDRSFSDAERERVGAYAAAFGVPDEQLAQIASSVKAYLMAPLIGLANTEAVVQVSEKLKI